ncbi:MAG: hypothetical protein GC181_04640 [Bacteroidetes bacterium]|nr:hypothetical protein [Bacteroidota bacterium]
MNRNTLFVALLTLAGIGWTFTSTGNQKEIRFEPVTESEEQIPYSKAFVRVFDVDFQSHTRYPAIDFGFPFTSFQFQMLEDQNPEGIIFTESDGDSYPIIGRAKTDTDDGRILSSFIITVKAQKTMDLQTGTLLGKVRVYLFFAPPVDILNKTSLKKSDDEWCVRPAMISRDVWRDGLPDPIGTREVTTTEHNIIHHAASSNSNHDYMNVIRNIYLLHTQSNGWDDIGYNFVVAQDGTIFEGRDPQGAGDDDLIKGAHFCGKNNLTMGICVLGNYMETHPTDQSINSLIKVLSWKCHKVNLDPKSSSHHPDASSPLLNAVAGHRDGCSTACPGDSLYLRIPEIIDSVYVHWKNCDGFVDVLKPLKSNTRIRILENEIQIVSDQKWESCRLINIAGQTLSSYSDLQTIQLPNAGIYWIEITYRNGFRETRRVVIPQH